MSTYQHIVLASRPDGVVVPGNFRLETVDVPALQDGQVLIRNHFLSLDPYMRMRMEDVKSYAAPQAIDAVMIGGTAGEIVQSRHPKFAVGDKVVGMSGWSEMGVSDGVGSGPLAALQDLKGAALLLQSRAQITVLVKHVWQRLEYIWRRQVEQSSGVQ